MKKTKPKKLTEAEILRKKRAVEYKAMLDQLGLTVAAKRTAIVLGIKNVRRAQRFAGEETEIPDSVMRLLRCYVEHGLPEDIPDDA